MSVPSCEEHASEIDTALEWEELNRNAQAIPGSAAERKQLLSLVRDGSAEHRIARRANAILLLNEGRRVLLFSRPGRPTPACLLQRLVDIVDVIGQTYARRM
jgi:peroxiredoxin